MINMGKNLRQACIVVLIVILAAAFSPGLSAKDKLPDVSHDGLHLQKDTKMAAVYLKPGATLDQYDRIALLDCFVSFKKNWQRDYNQDVVGLGQRISTKDMERIKKEVAEEFKKVYTKELETEGGYTIVDNAAEDVLVLRPAIINLDVTAPDTMSPGMSRTIVSSAGQMTLYLELYDSVTSDIIARIVDAQADRGPGGISNPATNKADADRILRRWADTLRSHLDAVKAAAAETSSKDTQP